MRLFLALKLVALCLVVGALSGAHAQRKVVHTIYDGSPTCSSALVADVIEYTEGDTCNVVRHGVGVSLAAACRCVCVPASGWRCRFRKPLFVLTHYPFLSTPHPAETE